MAGTLSFAFLETQAFMQAAQKFDLHSAQTHARRAAPIVHFYSFITAYQIPDLNVWRITLSVPQDIGEMVEETKKITQGLAQADQAAWLRILRPFCKTFRRK